MLILANGFRNSHSHARLHDFSLDSLVADYFFTLLRFSKLHILQHCSMKCMSCCVENVTHFVPKVYFTISPSLYPVHFPIKLCRMPRILQPLFLYVNIVVYFVLCMLHKYIFKPKNSKCHAYCIRDRLRRRR